MGQRRPVFFVAFVMKKRKLCYICSPLRGDEKGNIVKANHYSRYAYQCGYLPIAPHTIFTQYLDDTKGSERKGAMDMGLQLLGLCDELWVFGTLISEGMKREIDFARGKGIQIKSFKADMEDK